MKYIYEGVVVPASVIIPISAGLITGYKRDYLKVILFYLIFAGIIDVMEEIIGGYHINNLPLLHFYTIIEFLCLLRFFQLVFHDALCTSIIGIIAVAFSIFAILDMLFIQSIYSFNSYPRPIAALIIAGLCLFYFFKKGESENSESWINDPLNWVVTGLLLYFGSSFFHFAFLNVMYEKASLKVNLIFGAIHATLVMVMYLLFAAGFLYAKNQR